MREIFTWLLKWLVILKAIWKVIGKVMSIYCSFSVCFVMLPLGKSWEGTLKCSFLVLTYGVNNFLQWEEIVATRSFLPSMNISQPQTVLCLKQRVTLDSFPALHLSHSTLDSYNVSLSVFLLLSPNNGFCGSFNFMNFYERKINGVIKVKKSFVNHKNILPYWQYKE